MTDSISEVEPVPSMTIRGTLTLVMGGLVALALAAAGSLAVLTELLEKNTDTLLDALQSVRLAHEMELELLSHSRTADALARSSLEVDVRDKLERAARFVESPSEGKILSEAAERVEIYFADTASKTESGAPPMALQTAFGRLNAFVHVNVQQADAANDAARRLVRLGSLLGVSVSILVIFGVLGVIAGVTGFLTRPIRAIGEAIKRLPESDERIPELGPAELRDIARELNATRAMLARQRAERLVFLGSVAHDLRNPLSALRIAAAMFEDGKPLPPEGRLRSMLALVARQIDRLERMVGDLLDTTRIEAGQLELRFQRVDGRDLAREVLDLFGATLSPGQLELALPASPVLVEVDSLRIEQVLNNLISNAIKYSPPGSPIRLTVEQLGSEALFTVEDLGSGISPEDLPHIFEPFRRTASSKNTTPGLGLGLSVARRIVEAHKGKIEVESRTGRGTIVRVRLLTGDALDAQRGFGEAAPQLAHVS